MMVTQTVSTITAEKARLIAEDFLMDHLGDQTMAGEPLLIRSALSSAWVVPIVLTRSAYGPVGVIGSLVVDEITGQVIASTPQTHLDQKSDQLLAGQTSAIEKAFQQVVTGA